MRKLIKFFSKNAAVVLPALAVLFAASPCVGKLYEPKVPEQLNK